MTKSSEVKKYFHQSLFDEKEVTFENKTFGQDKSACNVCSLRDNCKARVKVPMWVACENVNRADILVLKQYGEMAIFMAETLLTETGEIVIKNNDKIKLNKDIQKRLLDILNVLPNIPLDKINYIFETI